MLAYVASYARHGMLEWSAAGGVGVSLVPGGRLNQTETYQESVSLEGSAAGGARERVSKGLSFAHLWCVVSPAHGAGKKLMRRSERIACPDRPS